MPDSVDWHPPFIGVEPVRYWRNRVVNPEPVIGFIVRHNGRCAEIHCMLPADDGGSRIAHVAYDVRHASDPDRGMYDQNGEWEVSEMREEVERIKKELGIRSKPKAA